MDFKFDNVHRQKVLTVSAMTSWLMLDKITLREFYQNRWNIVILLSTEVFSSKHHNSPSLDILIGL